MACAQTGGFTIILVLVFTSFFFFLYFLRFHFAGSADSLGSGKTAAFLFPMIRDMINNLTSDGRQQHGGGGGGYSRGYKVYPTALVLAPTRELAIQIHAEAKKVRFPRNLLSFTFFLCFVLGLV
jgi:superfamily II DNA/RNA helicase